MNGAQLDLFAVVPNSGYLFTGVYLTTTQVAIITAVNDTDTITVELSATTLDPNVPYIIEAGISPSLGLSSNTFYKFNDPITSLTIVALNAPEPGSLNIYAFSFTAGVDNPTITLPQGVQIADAPTIANGDYVEFNVLDGKAIAKVWSA